MRIWVFPLPADYALEVERVSDFFFFVISVFFSNVVFIIFQLYKVGMSDF